MNIQRLIKRHNKSLDPANDNVTTENIEELDKLHQILEEKQGDAMEIGEERDIIMEQL